MNLADLGATGPRFPRDARAGLAGPHARIRTAPMPTQPDQLAQIGPNRLTNA
jgi:hypothetical protein